MKRPAGPPIEPLLAVRVPADTRLACVVLSSEPDGQGRDRWRATVLRAEDWKAGCLRVFNAGRESVGIAAGTKRIPLAEGKSVDFHARDWGESFPVKIFRLQPDTKLVFSSTWRVTPGRRELCFIGNANGAILLRSLLALAPKPREPAR